MYNTACTFVLTIFTLYSIFRYMFLPNDYFKQQTLIHIEWQMSFLCAILIVIYHASRLTKEVKWEKNYHVCFHFH